MTAVFAGFEQRLGPLDIMINNAGIMPTGPLLEESDAVTCRILEINTFGCMTGTKLALALMVSRGSGHIVNMASTMGEASVPGLVSYNASKAAVIRFSDAARLEFRRMIEDRHRVARCPVRRSLPGGRDLRQTPHATTAAADR